MSERKKPGPKPQSGNNYMVVEGKHVLVNRGALFEKRGEDVEQRYRMLFDGVVMPFFEESSPLAYLLMLVTV